MSRICPKCKAKLGGYDRFFCTACGESLPADLVNHAGIFTRIANFATSSKEKSEPKVNIKAVINKLKLLNIKSVVPALLGVLLFVGVIFFIQKTLRVSIDYDLRLGKDLFKPQDTVIESTSTPIEYSKNVVEVPLAWEINTFGIDSIMKYVPFDSDIVIEGNDLTRFALAYSEIDPAYKNLAAFINGKADQHFVFFAKRIGEEFTWSLIYFPLAKDFSVAGDLVTKYNWLKFWKSDPIAAVTTQDPILSEISDTKGQTNKNFTQTPIYASSRASSPKNGKLFIYLTSQTAKDYFKTLQSMPKLPKELQMVVESVNKDDSDYSIIL